MNRYDLTDFEWSVIEPLLPNKPRGVPRVDDRSASGVIGVIDADAWARVVTEFAPVRATHDHGLNESGTAGHGLGMALLLQNRGVGQGTALLGEATIDLLGLLNQRTIEVAVASLRQLAPKQTGSDDGAQNLGRASADREHARVAHHALQRQVA